MLKRLNLKFGMKRTNLRESVLESLIVPATVTEILVPSGRVTKVLLMV